MLFSAWLAAWVLQAMAANAQLDGARSLLEHGRYQDTCTMLSAPQMHAMPSGTEFDLLLARAALETGNTAQAKALYTALLESGADDVQARLGLGRAYLAMGEYARAKYGLKTVLQLDELPPCLAGQAQVYADTAQKSMAGKRLVTAGFLQLGAGADRARSALTTTSRPRARASICSIGSMRRPA